MRILFNKYSYQKLRHEVIFQKQDANVNDNDQYYNYDPIKRSLPTPRLSWFTRVRVRPRARRLRVKIAGLRKLFRFRRVRIARISWAKVVQRFKESQAHFGDLFAGNYLFMQVAPASTNNKPYLTQHNHNYNYNHNHKQKQKHLNYLC